MGRGIDIIHTPALITIHSSALFSSATRFTAPISHAENSLEIEGMTSVQSLNH